MKYGHIINYVAKQPWAILPSKMEEILAVLAFRAHGGTLTPEEIQARIGSRTPASRAPQGVAVVPLRGMISHRMGTLEESSGGMSAEAFTLAINAVRADDSIGTIVIDTDSPGGTLSGLVEAADAVYAARSEKRVIAVANAMMASAAYWIASQAHEIVSIPSFDPLVGSIGVFAVHEDLSAHLQQEGVNVTLIKAGDHKFENNPFAPLTAEARQHIQSAIDAAYDQFIKTVARGRGVAQKVVRSGYGEGRALSAADALAAGLIDRIAPMGDVLSEAATGRRRRATVTAAAATIDTGTIAGAVIDETTIHETRTLYDALAAAAETPNPEPDPVPVEETTPPDEGSDEGGAEADFLNTRVRLAESRARAI